MGFSDRFSRCFTGIIACAEILLTIAIIGLELRSNYIDLAHGTIWIGFWAGIIFIKTCFITSCTTICCHGRCFGFYVLIFSVLSGLLAILMIYFDQLFINDPCKCYLGDQLCCAVGSIPSFSTNYTERLNTCANAIVHGTISSYVCQSVPYDKVPILKAQLGCAVGMLISCGLYSILFIFACAGVCFGH